jgi:pimeloyl-ACP methyl ester carboxylesterase
MSDRGSQIFTLEQRMHDVQAILDKVDCKQASLFGVSEGGPMALLYAATYPRRASAMVLYGSYAKRSWARDYPFGWNDEQWQRALNDIEQHWGTPEALTISMRVPGAGEEYAERAASYFRASASPGAAAAIMRMNREIDVQHVLPATRLPTLIVHRTGDRVIDVQHARYLAHHIPGAKLMGWDQPEVSCCILARPTKKMGLYRQMVGRVLRPAPDKPNAIVIDHSGATYRHGFVEDGDDLVTSSRRSDRDGR